MLYRLVRPVKRPGSSIPQFVQRIPADVRDRAIGRSITFKLGVECVTVTIGQRMDAVRFSLRTRDPAEAKIRHAKVAAQLETVWRALRAERPVSLGIREGTALAGDLYRAWADERRGRTIAIVMPVAGDPWQRDHSIIAEEEGAGFASAARHLLERTEAEGLEPVLGPLVDRLLLDKGIAGVAAEIRPLLLNAFSQALREAFEHRERNARGDYRPDPNAERFPEWRHPHAEEKTPEPPPLPKRKVSVTGLVEGWWQEAQGRDLKPSTYESYRNTAGRFVQFLKHDDATRITPEDIIRFKDYRLASINPRTGRRVSAKTVKDSDLAGLKAVFGWAVDNRKLPSNPAAGVTLRVGKRPKLRSKGFTDEEAQAILRAASSYVGANRERPQTATAKRWVPWLCAYTGARVGELAQLRKQDVRREGEHWVIRITPDAGTVKTNEARDVVLHTHLVELGFPEFVQNAPLGHLFLKPAKSGDVRGPLRGLKNRLQEFVRTVVTDPNVAPNHGWRHRFKTVGMAASIDHRVLDAIQGQAPATVAGRYGEVTLGTMAEAIARLPRLNLEAPESPRRVSIE